MDLNELQASHPDVYKAAVQVGHDQGVAQERDRVCAHLQMGEQSGALERAMTAVRSGEGMTQTLSAEYMTAAMNRASGQTRQAEEIATAAALETVEPATEAESLLDRAAAALGV